MQEKQVRMLNIKIENHDSTDMHHPCGAYVCVIRIIGGAE